MRKAGNSRMRFNPPPNWPPAPPGWAPEPAWQPDPAWGPPPPGWQLWVSDNTDAALPYPPEYAVAHPYPPQAPKSKKALWLSLAAVAAVVLLGAGLVWFVGSGATKSTTDASPASGKTDLTAVGKELLVDRSQFPDLDGGQWRDWANDDAGADDNVMPGDITVSPQECADLFGGPSSATQHAGARLTNQSPPGMRSVGVHLALTKDQPDVHAYLDNCRTFTISTDLPGLNKTLDMTGTVEPLEAAGIPSWAAGYRTETSSSLPGLSLSTAMKAAAISGYYRGVLVEASYERIVTGSSESRSGGTDMTEELVALFTAQVAKLEAAP